MVSNHFLPHAFSFALSLPLFSTFSPISFLFSNMSPIQVPSISISVPPHPATGLSVALNITHIFLQNMITAMQSWKEDMSQLSSGKPLDQSASSSNSQSASSQFHPFFIRNETGITMWYSISSANPRHSFAAGTGLSLSRAPSPTNQRSSPNINPSLLPNPIINPSISGAIINPIISHRRSVSSPDARANTTPRVSLSTFTPSPVNPSPSPSPSSSQSPSPNPNHDIKADANNPSPGINKPNTRSSNAQPGPGWVCVPSGEEVPLRIDSSGDYGETPNWSR